LRVNNSTSDYELSIADLGGEISEGGVIAISTAKPD
jgi:hypothetical protein